MFTLNRVQLVVIVNRQLFPKIRKHTLMLFYIHLSRLLFHVVFSHIRQLCLVDFHCKWHFHIENDEVRYYSVLL